MALTSAQKEASKISPELGVNIVQLAESNTADLVDGTPKAIWIKSGGTLAFVTTGGSEVSISSVPSDIVIDWIQMKKLKTTTSCVVFGIY